MLTRLAVATALLAAATAGCTGADTSPLTAPTASVSTDSAGSEDDEPSAGPSADPSGASPSDGARMRTIKIFLSTPNDCGDVRPVDRQVPDTPAIATAALNELFSGRVTEEERAAGLRGFGPSTAGLLRRLRIADGIAYVDLNASHRDIIGFASTSCGAAAFNTPIASTLRQFPTVTKVRFAFDGDPRAFIEFAQGACPDEPIPPGDPCDPRPWA